MALEADMDLVKATFGGVKRRVVVIVDRRSIIGGEEDVDCRDDFDVDGVGRGDGWLRLKGKESGKRVKNKSSVARRMFFVMLYMGKFFGLGLGCWLKFQGCGYRRWVCEVLGSGD
mmetsp:Transcript_14669/g.30145  ORF Transcript_14669/g.30145 Transcript_14669/m.30145 type:complete len:115 (-) Transcript_14669:28-372(-)